MPGLVGLAGAGDQASRSAMLQAMAGRLEHEARFRTELAAGDGFALGRVSLGLANPGMQPLWNADRTVCLAMEGEIYSYDRAALGPEANGHMSPLIEGAALALRLYEQCGMNFVSLLNGAFVLALWDSRTRELLLANDRLGLYPLYYTQRSGTLAFASGVRALLADPALARTVDMIALNEFLVFDHVQGDRTLLADVRLLPQGSFLSFRDGRAAITRYWRPQYPDTYELTTEDEYLEELLRLLRQAVARQSADNRPSGLLLSGGLDSRVLLALLTERRNGKPLHSFTFGIPGCDDARYAREAASVARAEPHFYPLEPGFLLRTAQESIRLTDGLGNCVNLHALATLEPESRHATVIYKGFMGDALLGLGLRRLHWADYPAELLGQAHLQAHLDHRVITFNEAEQAQLLTDSFRRAVAGRSLDTYTATMHEARTRLPANQRLYYDLVQRVPRMTLNGAEVMRSRVIVRLPFCDNDLVDFVLTIPPGLLFGRYLIKRAFVENFRSLAKVPYSETGLPMVSCWRDVRMRAEHVLRWHLREAGLKWIPEDGWRPYKNYGAWFRSVLRAWLEDLVLSPRAQQRGYFNPVYVRQLVDEHMRGANHTVKLGAPASVELWHRQFLD